MLEARDLWFRYRPGGPWVVAGVDLGLVRGEVLGLRGPSGSGKTTVARLLSGFLPPERGEVRVDGAPLGPTAAVAPAAGAAPVQLVSQHPELAVDPRWRLGDTLAEAGAPDPGLLDALSIAPGWLGRYPHELSGGELQRVTAARALLTGAPYLVADEVSAMLDPLTQAQIWHVLLDRVRATGLAVLAVSHDDALLAAVAGRVVDVQEPTRQTAGTRA